jgi:hypothetical protein
MPLLRITTTLYQLALPLTSILRIVFLPDDSNKDLSGPRAPGSNDVLDDVARLRMAIGLLDLLISHM